MPAAADDRADWTAGIKSPIKTPMMAMTTSSSIKVKARRMVPSRTERRRRAPAKPSGKKPMHFEMPISFDSMPVIAR